MTQYELAQLIFTETCQYFHVPESQVKSKCRKREFVEPRQFSCYFMKRYTRLSLADIGFLVGKKEHATAIHSIRTVNNLIDMNGYAETALKIKQNIDNAIMKANMDWSVHIAQL